MTKILIEICDSFISHCKCRIALLFFQVIIFLAIFLFYGMFAARKLLCEDKLIFFLWIGISTGFFVMVFEVIWCWKCPFFRIMMTYYRKKGYSLFVRFFILLVHVLRRLGF
jgi:hypothetical protein